MHGPQLHGTNSKNRCCSLISKWELLLSLSLSAESFVQLRFLLLPKLLIRPPALPEPNLEPHRGSSGGSRLTCCSVCPFYHLEAHGARDRWRRTHTHTHIESFIFPYIDLQVLCWTQLWYFTNCLSMWQVWGERKMAHLHMNIFLVLALATCYLCALLEGSHFIYEFHWMSSVAGWEMAPFMAIPTTSHQSFVCCC